MSVNHLAPRTERALICAAISLLSVHCYGQSSSKAASVSASSATTSTPQSSISASDLLQSRLELGDGRQIWHPTLAELGFTLAPSVDPSGPSSKARLVSDRARAISYFTGIAKYVQRPPVGARPIVLTKYARNPLSILSSCAPVPAKILPSREGAALLVDQAADTVIAALNANPCTTHIVLPTRKDYSAITEDQLSGIDARIGHFVTAFNPYDRGRTRTVRRAIGLVNNNFIPPGGVFSLNKIVGERTEARGFGVGHVFVNKAMKLEVGGGMCQVATTLFNAALLANLEIIERHQHIRTVPYVLAGSDATVWWGAKDLKIKNNTSSPVYICYSTTGSHAICDIFGKAYQNTKVEVVTSQHRFGPRNYAGSITRYTTVAGARQMTYQAFSRYKWTPALDYSR